MIDLLPHLINGLTLGLLFALIALGFTLIVGVMELINLAHGSLFALGAYLAVAVLGFMGAAGFEGPNPAQYAVALIAAPLGVAVVGMGLEVAMRRTYGKEPLYGLLLTFGAALVIEEGIRQIWGTAEGFMPVPQAISGSVLLGG